MDQSGRLSGASKAEKGVRGGETGLLDQTGSATTRRRGSLPAYLKAKIKEVARQAKKDAEAAAAKLVPTRQKKESLVAVSWGWGGEGRTGEWTSQVNSVSTLD